MEKTLKWNAFPYEEPSWRLNISAPISVMQAFWQQCLESLKRLTQNTPKIYTTWFEVLKPTYWNEKDGILTLEAPATKITYIRGAYQKSISAVAYYCTFLIIWMDSFFHDFHLFLFYSFYALSRG